MFSNVKIIITYNFFLLLYDKKISQIKYLILLKIGFGFYSNAFKWNKNTKLLKKVKIRHKKKFAITISKIIMFFKTEND